MKKKFSKILGVGLTLALMVSLLLTASPVSALTQPSVSVDDNTISVETDYSIVFDLGVEIGLESTLTFAASTAGVVTVTAGSAGATITYPDLTGTGVTISGTGTGGATTSVMTSGQTTIFTADTTASVRTDDLVLTAGSVTIALTSGSATISETALPNDIIIDFPEGTDLTNVAAADVAIAATSGIGSVTITAGTFTIVKSDDVATGPTLTATLTGLTGDDKIGVGAMVQVVVSDVINPDDPDDYTLDVSTSNEDAVTSAAYEIEVPSIGVLPGIVQQFNATDILMNQATGDDAINTLVDSADEDYTIVVGPGEYEITATIALDEAGVTLESSAGAEDTIIVVDASVDAVQITADDVTIDGFTIEDTLDTYTAIKVTSDDVTVINNIMTDTAEAGYPEGISIEGSAAGATVTGNEHDLYHTMMVQNTASDLTLSDNIFGAGINLHNTPSDITITGNTITGSELWGIVLWTGGTYTDIVIEDNTISETAEGDAIGICVQGTAAIDDLAILGNDIIDNEGVGIVIESDVAIVTGSAIAIKFNTITGNDADGDGYGIQNDGDTAVIADADATLNWWGTAVAADVAAMVNDTDEGVTTYEPFLADTVEAVLSASEIVVGAESLDAEDTAGVEVSGATGATVISAAKYISNPQAAISDAIAFFDVYVAGPAATVEVTIKFHAGDGDSELHMWSADTEAWVEREDADYSVYGGYMYDDVDADLLGGTPFAVVAGGVGDLDAPELLAPAVGDDTVSLTPTFAWGAVDDATGYEFQLDEGANFVLPMVDLTGDTGRLIVTAYHYATELPYSTAYYWRVKAVSASAESGWASGIFVTMAEPEEPTPPVVVEPTPPAPPAPVITIEQPDIIVPLPDVAAPITPSWIYVIIGVGAVLVIALLVLIVRTRRVA